MKRFSENGAHNSLSSPRARVAAKACPLPGVALNPPVPQPQLKNKFFTRRRRQYRRTVGRNVYNSRPLPQHIHPRKNRIQLQNRSRDMLNLIKTAALGVGVIRVGTAADNQFALVGLADIGMHGVGHNHAIQHRCERLRHKCLQRKCFYRQAKSRHFRQCTAVAGDDRADSFARANRPARSAHSFGDSVFNVKSGDFAVLDNIYAQRIGGAGESPCHRIVPRNAASPLQKRAQYRIASV